MFFDVDIGNAKAGRIEFELFANVVPKTAGACSSLFIIFGRAIIHECAHVLCALVTADLLFIIFFLWRTRPRARNK